MTRKYTITLSFLKKNLLFTIAIFRIKSSVEVDAGVVDVEVREVTKVVITGATTEVTMVVICPDPPVEETRGGAAGVVTASDDVNDGGVDVVTSDADDVGNPRRVFSSSSLMGSSTSSLIFLRFLRTSLSTPDISKTIEEKEIISCHSM